MEGEGHGQACLKWLHGDDKGTGSCASPEMQELQHQGLGKQRAGRGVPLGWQRCGQRSGRCCPAIGQGQKSPRVSALFSFPAQGPAQVSAGGNSHVLQCSITLGGEPVFELVHATFLLPTPSGQNSGVFQPNPNPVTSMVALGHPDRGVNLHFPC